MNINNADNTVTSLQKQISFLQGMLPSVNLLSWLAVSVCPIVFFVT